MSVPLQNDLLLRALLREPTPRTPLWMMRQAGRYLPEYRATRAKAGSFLELCMNPELACEVTLQPLARYRLDAAILFSDILTIPHAMNVGLEFEAGEGPKIARPVRTPGRHRPAADAGPRGRAALRDGRRAPHPPRARRPRAADRLRRQPVDRRHLHGRGRQQQELPAHQGHALRRARRAAPAARGDHARHARLPQRAGRRRRAGGDGVRHLGRRAHARATTASSRCATCSASSTA